MDDISLEAFQAAFEAATQSIPSGPDKDEAQNIAVTALRAAAPHIGASYLRMAADRLGPDPEWEVYVGTVDEGRLMAACELRDLADELAPVDVPGEG